MRAVVFREGAVLLLVSVFLLTLLLVGRAMRLAALLGT